MKIQLAPVERWSLLTTADLQVQPRYSRYQTLGSLFSTRRHYGVSLDVKVVQAISQT